MDKNKNFFNRFKRNKKETDDISLNSSVYEFACEKPSTDNNNIDPLLEDDIFFEDTTHIYPVKELEDMSKSLGDTESLYSEKILKLLEPQKSDEDGENVRNYYKYNNQDCVDFYTRNYSVEYTEEEKKFRNDVLFNTEHERFKSKLDPWLFTEHTDIVWPDYVKKLYYTRLTPYRHLVRLSYSSILYLNRMFLTQTFAPALRIFFCPMYEMTSKLMREPDRQDVFKKFINEEFVMNYGNIEIIHRDTELIERDFILSDKELFSKNIEDEQPTNVAYKSFFDYIPICMIPYKELENNNIDNILFSDICFHKHGCHDNSCTTHNDKNIFYKNAHEHCKGEELYEIKQSQLISCKSLIRF